MVGTTLRDEAGSDSKFERRIFGSKVELPGPAQVPALMEDFGNWVALNPNEATTMTDGCQIGADGTFLYYGFTLNVSTRIA